MPDLCLTIVDSDRRRKRPLVRHMGLSLTDLAELEAVYLALSYQPAQLRAAHDTAVIPPNASPTFQVVS